MVDEVWKRRFRSRAVSRDRNTVLILDETVGSLLHTRTYMPETLKPTRPCRVNPTQEFVRQLSGSVRPRRVYFA